jgi:hypothetical protein
MSLFWVIFSKWKLYIFIIKKPYKFNWIMLVDYADFCRRDRNEQCEQVDLHIWCNKMAYWLYLYFCWLSSYLSITWYKLHFLLSGFFMEDMGVWKKMAGKKIISAKCAIPKLRMSLDNCHSQIHFFFLTPVFFRRNLDVNCTYFPNEQKNSNSNTTSKSVWYNWISLKTSWRRKL